MDFTQASERHRVLRVAFIRSITHDATCAPLAKSLMFALPPAGSQPKRAPVPWDPATPYKALGFREVEADAPRLKYEITELPLRKV